MGDVTEGWGWGCDPEGCVWEGTCEREGDVMDGSKTALKVRKPC